MSSCKAGPFEAAHAAEYVENTEKRSERVEQQRKVAESTVKQSCKETENTEAEPLKNPL